MHTSLTEADFLAAVSRRWKLPPLHRQPSLALAGSPERSLWRGVVEADDGRRFILEKIPSRDYARKRRIVAILCHLAAQGVAAVVPYRPDRDGECLPLIDHALWQLSPYVAGIDLQRPAYVMDGWRGDAVADFLIAFSGACDRTPPPGADAPFSIVDYCRRLMDVLSRRHSRIADRCRGFMERLERRLFAIHDRLPRRFCHGDLHPLNIIWGAADIRAVIDWEFCGMKAEIYDLANLLGCLGMEDPRSLEAPFVRRLVARLDDAGIYRPQSWQALPDMVLAVRFAWLSEWLRKDDRPMIQMELDYMRLLSDGPLAGVAGN